jgi:hypothetical protein
MSVSHTLKLEKNTLVPSWLLRDAPGVFGRGVLNARGELVLPYPESMRRYDGHPTQTALAVFDLKRDPPTCREVVVKGIPADVDMLTVTLSPKGNKAVWLMRLMPGEHSKTITGELFTPFMKEAPRVWAIYVSNPLLSAPRFQAYFIGRDEIVDLTWRQDGHAIHLIGAHRPEIPWILKVR